MGASKERIHKIGELVRRAEALPDREARSLCAELVQVVMEFHAAGLERMLSIVLQQENGPAILASFAGDDLAANVLLLHGLHPDDLQTDWRGRSLRCSRFSGREEPRSCCWGSKM